MLFCFFLMHKKSQFFVYIIHIVMILYVFKINQFVGVLITYCYIRMLKNDWKSWISMNPIRSYNYIYIRYGIHYAKYIHTKVIEKIWNLLKKSYILLCQRILKKFFSTFINNCTTLNSQLNSQLFSSKFQFWSKQTSGVTLYRNVLKETQLTAVCYRKSVQTVLSAYRVILSYLSVYGLHYP